MAIPEEQPADHEKQHGKAGDDPGQDVARIGWLGAHHGGAAIATQPGRENAEQADESNACGNDH